MRASTARHFRQVESLPEPTPETPRPGKVQVIVLASGSKGNCLLVVSGASVVMVDCGITPDEAARRSRAVGYHLTRLDALLVTHWHKDHVKHASDICRAFNCPLISSSATLLGMETQPAKHRRAQPGEAIEIDPFTVHPIKIEHEEGSIAYHIHVAGKDILVAHDLGAPNSTLLAAARAADCLCIEANHDVGLLESCTNASHTAELHSRVLSTDRGHLSNVQCSEVVGCVDPAKIQAICLLHLSSSHNTEQYAEGCIRAAIPTGASPQVYVARQDSAVLMEVNGGPAKIELPLIDQFRRLDRQVDAVINEQKRADAETAERRVVMGEHLAAMRELFEQKEPGEKLDGFEFFDAWKVSKAQAYGVSERTMNYYLLDAETVVPIIGRETAISLPLGTVSELGKLAKAKGHIPPATLQFAKEHTQAEVKAHVASILYPGRTGHFDGAEDFLSITAGKEKVAFLRKQIDEARVFVGKEAPDHEVVEYALHHFIEYSRDEATKKLEAEGRSAFTPMPPPPDFDLLDSIIEEDENAAAS